MKLVLIDGFYTSEAEINNAILNAKLGKKKSPLYPSDYPKYFEMIARPYDFKELADAIKKILE